MKKQAAPWRRDILKHHKKRKSRAERAKFPPHVVRELKRWANGRCQCGCGRPDNETHHVMPRARGGRGVITNGMRVNTVCNGRIHADEAELQHWIDMYAKLYGPDFYKDDIDKGVRA